MSTDVTPEVVIKAVETRKKSRTAGLIDKVFTLFNLKAQLEALKTKRKALQEALSHIPGLPGHVSSAMPSLTDDEPITGYGPVNMWWRLSDEILLQIIKLMQLVNVRVFPLELLGNGDEDMLGTPYKLDRMKAKFIYVVEQCRTRGIWVNAIVGNDNAGKGNWKNGNVKLSSRIIEYKGVVTWLAGLGLQDAVFYTPMGEPTTSTGKTLEHYTISVLGPRGYWLDSNAGHRPQEPAPGTQGFCYHPVNTGDWPRSTKGHVLSDTGAILAQLNINNEVYGLGNPDMLRHWKQIGLDKKQKMVCYYGFQTNQFDEASIRAMSNTKD